MLVSEFFRGRKGRRTLSPVLWLFVDDGWAVCVDSSRCWDELTGWHPDVGGATGGGGEAS